VRQSPLPHFAPNLGTGRIAHRTRHQATLGGTVQPAASPPVFVCKRSRRGGATKVVASRRTRCRAHPRGPARTPVIPGVALAGRRRLTRGCPDASPPDQRTAVCDNVRSMAITNAATSSPDTGARLLTRRPPGCTTRVLHEPACVRCVRQMDLLAARPRGTLPGVRRADCSHRSSGGRLTDDADRRTHRLRPRSAPLASCCAWMRRAPSRSCAGTSGARTGGGAAATATRS